MLFQSCKDGEKYRREILELGKPYNESSVKTLRDLNADIISYGTIEDTLDSEYVVKCLNTTFNDYTKKSTCEFIYKGEKPILEEFKIWMQKEDITKDNTSDETLSHD